MTVVLQIFVAGHLVEVYSTGSRGEVIRHTTGSTHMEEYVTPSRSIHALTCASVRVLIDRRSFLKTGVFAAGAVLGYSLTSCDSGGFSIPCLGPAPPPTPIPGMTYLRASRSAVPWIAT